MIIAVWIDLYYISRIKSDHGLLNVRVTSFKKHEVELLKYVTNPKLVDIGTLPSEKEVYDLLIKDPADDHETAERLAKAYQGKIAFLYELQCGRKIFSYDYLREHGVKLDQNFDSKRDPVPVCDIAYRRWNADMGIKMGGK